MSRPAAFPFVPVPNAVFPLCRTSGEVSAVVALYARARNQARWKPFPLSVRQFAALGVGEPLRPKAARELLFAMEDAGLLMWDPNGGRRGGQVTVFDPVLGDVTNSSQETPPTQVEKHHVKRADLDSKGVCEDSETVRETPPAETRKHSPARDKVDPRATRPDQTRPDQEENTRPAKPSEASVPDGWGEVVEAYREYRSACGIQRLPNPKPKTGQGAHLARCLSVRVDEFDGEPGGKIGPERFARLLRWLSTSGHSRARYYRESRCDAENIKRHLAALWGLMMAEADSPSQAQTRQQPQGPDLWDVYLLAARASRFDFETFRENLPADQRERILAASRTCRAFGRLKNSSNDFQRREIADDFRKALEMT